MELIGARCYTDKASEPNSKTRWHNAIYSFVKINLQAVKFASWFIQCTTSFGIPIFLAEKAKPQNQKYKG